jgi:hypothetical protein
MAQVAFTKIVLRHQQIGVKLITIHPLFLVYFFCNKCCNYWLLLHHAQTLIIAIIAYLLLQLIVSASNYLHYLQLFSLL